MDGNCVKVGWRRVRKRSSSDGNGRQTVPKVGREGCCKSEREKKERKTLPEIFPDNTLQLGTINGDAAAAAAVRFVL